MKTRSNYLTTTIACLILMISATGLAQAQNISGSELLDKAIRYHDPNGNWSTFDGALQVTMTMPEGNPRISDIKINLPEEYFSVTAKRDTITTTYTLDKEKCFTSIKVSPEEGKRTPCETAALYKNYYTYLYGLPMKLKDNGTKISEEVERKVFKGKEYLVLKVTYEESVGSDVWFFYFDPDTFAMEIYQFFKTENGTLLKDSGEYILLDETMVVNGIKIPKKRAWYYNKDEKYLGTDTLN